MLLFTLCKRKPVWLPWLYAAAFGLAYSQEALFSSNQNTKFITGLALAGYGDIAADWMARITDPFPLFSHVLAWQYRIFGLHMATHASFLLLAGAYGLLSLLLAKDLYKGEKTGRAALLFALLWLFMHSTGMRDFFQDIAAPGLAGQYLLGDYYQPCCFGVLLLAAVAAYRAGKLIVAAGCLIVAPLFHPAYLISSALMACVLALLPANSHLGITVRSRVLFLALAGAGLGFWGLWNFTALTSGDPAVRDAAYLLMAQTRIPQHALPWHWKIPQTIIFFLAGIAAAWLGRRHLIGQLVGLLLGLIAAAALWTLIDFNPTVAVAAPWRVSVIVAPLSWIVLIAAAARRLSRMPFSGRLLSESGRKWIVAACIGACFGGVVHLALDYTKKQQRKDHGLTRFLAKHHERGNQYLIAPAETRLRLEAGVPVYATWKSHPTKDSEFLDWYERVELARSVYEGSSPLPEADFRKLCRTYALTHAVWPEAKGKFPYAGSGLRVYADSHYSVWKIEP